MSGTERAAGTGLSKLLSRLADLPATAVFLSFVYPTSFAVSQNWYAFATSHVIALVLAVCGIAFAASAVPAALSWFAEKYTHLSARTAGAVAAGILCAGALVGLLYGTLSATFGNAWVLAVVFCIGAGALSVLFMAGKQVLFSGVLAVLTTLSIADLGFGVVSLHTGLGSGGLAARTQEEFARFELTRKPNIYLLSYDAYGNRAALQDIFGIDNSPHYEALSARGFTTIDTFSNYHGTWSSFLSVFLGEHHYYNLADGISDSKLGRSIMAGHTVNPVLETLRRNDYKTQYINANRYLFSDQGVLDYVYPQAAGNSVVRIFGNPLIDALAGQEKVFSSEVRMAQQTKALLGRLPEMTREGHAPWFTLSYFGLPQHSPTNKDWRDMDGYIAKFPSNLKRSNDQMLSLIGEIRRADPDGLVIIFGDHGTWRYRGALSSDKDPNKAMAQAGVAPRLVGLDMFGVVLAMHDPSGDCQGNVYPTLTPVNLMRVIFHCLSGAPVNRETWPADISINGEDKRKRARVVVKDGQVLSKWERF